MSLSTDAKATVVRTLLGASLAGLSAFLAYKLYSHSRRPRSVKPGINDHFEQMKSPEEFVQRFEGESREIAAKLPSILSSLRIPPGSHVADLGAGTGLFLRPLAEAVGAEGKVYAIDPMDAFIEHMQRRVANELSEEQASVVSIHANTHFAMGRSGKEIPDGSLDLVLIIDAYHHLEYPSIMLKDIARKLKGGGQGRLAILDFERIPGVSSEWVLGHVRANRETVQAEVEAAGFKLVENLKEEVGLQENYLVVFEKK